MVRRKKRNFVGEKIINNKTNINKTMQQDIDMLNEAMEAMENEVFPQSSFNFDIIAITAKKINSGKLNVYDDSQVSWEEVTMYDLDNIKRLLLLIDTSLLEETADAIIYSINGKYNPTDPYYKPEVRSKYYNPPTAILWQQGDWDYEGAIRVFVEQQMEKKKKGEEFQKKLEQKRQERFITPAPLEMMESKTEDKLRKAEETIKELKERIALLEEEKSVSVSSEYTNVDLEKLSITCGPYEIAEGKKTAFVSVVWAMIKQGFFVKKKGGNYATNKEDVVNSLLTTKVNVYQLFSKALKTNTFMNVFNDLLDKASEMYAKAMGKG